MCEIWEFKHKELKTYCKANYFRSVAIKIALAIFLKVRNEAVNIDDNSEVSICLLITCEGTDYKPGLTFLNHFTYQAYEKYTIIILRIPMGVIVIDKFELRSV